MDLRNTASRKRRREVVNLRAKVPFLKTIPFRRSASPLTSLMKESLKTGIMRTNIEDESVPIQCEKVIFPPTEKTKCWLCGFPILGMNTFLKDKGYLYSAFLDSAVCEHVLPVRLAYFLTGLQTDYGLGGIYGDDMLLHTEYEYAHHYCNVVKSNQHFITKRDENENWCGVDVNEEKIDAFLTNVYGGYRSSLGDPIDRVTGEVNRHESGIFQMNTEKGKVERVFNNIVQCYVANALEGDFEKWKTAQKAKMIRKCEGLIKVIKSKDGCDTETPGILYQNAMRRLNNIRRYGKIMPQYGPQPHTVARMSSFQLNNTNLGNLNEAPTFVPLNAIAEANEGSSESNNKPLVKRRKTVKVKQKAKKRRYSKKRRSSGFLKPLKSFLQGFQ